MKSWQGLHRAQAWTAPDEATVLGDFDDADLAHRGDGNRFSRRDGAFFVTTDGLDGVVLEFQVLGVIGAEPLQQYFAETIAFLASDKCGFITGHVLPIAGGWA